MQLAPGTRVGPYEVVGVLGIGGMGEVFRAHDARLKRDVALKLLPVTSATDADRRARFEREAQVLAALSHPAIAQVFGVEHHEGAPVIVMELVEGETLAERLTRGPLPLDETLAIATQLCDGLDAAHERGIIHRDLKPANIKLMPSGAAKILDFGLARVVGAEVHTDLANSPTMLGGRTELGSILGTAAYMSPEQARARAVDKRADIWAFGCIVYEMLTGTAAFSGESTTDVLADVVRVEVDWTAVPATVPRRVVDVLRRCLEKNPRDRWHDVADVRIELQQAMQARPEPAAVAATAAAVPPRGRGWLLAVAGLVVGIAATTGALRWSALAAPAAADPPPTRAIIQLPPDTNIALSRGAALALSPDGRQLIFTGRSSNKTYLFRRALDSFESHPIAGTENAANPFFSPDGRWVGFFSGDHLKKVALDGGAPVDVTDSLNPRGEVWGSDDAIFITPSNNRGIVRVSALNGKASDGTSLQKGELSHRWPSLLPDGSALFYSVWNDTGWETSRIIVQRLATGERKTLVEAGGGYPRYLRDREGSGFFIYARAEGLLASRFDESALALTGQPIPVVDGVITNLSGGAHFDVSPSGTLAYIPGERNEAVRSIARVGFDGTSEPAIAFTGGSRIWRLSPDGTRVVRNTTSGSADLWIDDLQRHTSMRLTNGSDLYYSNGVWSPDGNSIIFARGAPVMNLYRRRADGTGAEERLTTTAATQVATSVSPDGRSLMFVQYDPVNGADLWTLTLPAPGMPAAPPQPYVLAGFNQDVPAFSPDGRWVAYQSNESGRFEVYVRSFPGGERVTRVSVDGGLSPKWSRDGRQLYFLRANDNQMVGVPVTLTPDFRMTGGERSLFDARRYEVNFEVLPDGKGLMMMPQFTSQDSATQINIVFNFLTELRQRVR